MKQFLKITTLLLAMILLCLAPAQAAEPIIPYTSEYLASYSASINHSGTTLYVKFSAHGYEYLDTIGAVRIVIQRSPNNESWANLYTFTYSSYPNMVASGKSMHASSVSYTGTSGYYYRAYVTIWAAKNGVNEYRYIYTNSVKL